LENSASICSTRNDTLCAGEQCWGISIIREQDTQDNGTQSINKNATLRIMIFSICAQHVVLSVFTVLLNVVVLNVSF
jgi:hypothetical protein